MNSLSTGEVSMDYYTVLNLNLKKKLNKSLLKTEVFK